MIYRYECKKSGCETALEVKRKADDLTCPVCKAKLTLDTQQLVHRFERLAGELNNSFECDETRRELIRMYCAALGVAAPKWGPA